MNTAYKINLEVFEGPLDLLLHLIKKNQVDIYDIPIVEITNQYNAYLAQMEEMQLGVAGEFILMASTLVHIKSRTLLPKELIQDDEADDPREELVMKLIEHQALKEAAGNLHQLQVMREAVFAGSKGFAQELNDDGDWLIEASIFDLISSFKTLCERNAVKNTLEYHKISITIGEQVQFILTELNLFKSVSLQDLFEKMTNKMVWIVGFLALLELVRLQFVKVIQPSHFGTVRLARNFAHLPDSEINAICRQFGNR